jgi:molybdate transport system substrate-binding protein
MPTCRFARAIYWPIALCIGCDRASPPAETLTLFAAASLVDVVADMAAVLSDERGMSLVVNLAGSSTLAQQITAGAHADLFLSASTDWVDALDRRALVARRRIVAHNRLVIITPADARGRIDNPADLLDASVARLALADPESVPAGVYARQALEQRGLWETLRPRVAAAADVRQALAFVARGEAEAGVVYATDVHGARGVRVACDLPAAPGAPIAYEAALLRDAEGSAAARRVFEWLAGADCRAILARRGFIPSEP